MAENTPPVETINEIILRIIGLESLDGVPFDEYYGLLLEQVDAIQEGNSDLSLKEELIILEEAKKIKPFAKKTPDDDVTSQFNIKKRSVNKDKLLGKSQKSQSTTVKPTAKLIPKKSSIHERVSGDNGDVGTENSDVLTSILTSVTNILDVLKNQAVFDKKVYQKNLREKEQKRREDSENKLESAFQNGIAGLRNISSKVFSPFQDIIARLVNFFTWLFLGKAFQSIMKWVTNPENEKKVKFLGNLLKTFWPAILAAVVLFLTPFGSLIKSIVSTIISWTIKISRFAIPKLLKFIAKHPAAAAAIAVGAAVAGATVLGKRKEDENINSILKKEAESEGKPLVQKQKENEQNKSWFDRFGDAFNVGQLGMGGVNPMGFSQGGAVPNMEYGYNGIDSNTGESIRGAGPDTQLIAARPGEVVLTPEDQSHIFQRTGFDIPGFVGNRKPKFVNGSNIRFTNPDLLGKDTTKIPKFESGGIVGGNKYRTGTKEFGEEPLIREAIKAGMKGDELAAFLAQISHETGGYKWSRELGGGHDHYGGGKKYHGRGYIQLTHDYNYKHYGDKLGIDLVKDPDLALKPNIAAKIALEYWKETVRPMVKGNWNDPFLHSSAVNNPSASDPSQINHYDDRVNRFNYYRNNLDKVVSQYSKKETPNISGKVLSSKKIGGAVYTEREGGVYTKNGIPVSKDQYAKSVGSQNAGVPLQTIRNVLGKSAQAQSAPKSNQPKKSNQQKLVEQRPWFDKFGWFGGASRWNKSKKQGGGIIPITTESGMDIPGITEGVDSEFLPGINTIAQPGEHLFKYMFTKDSVQKGVPAKVLSYANFLTEKTDSNSNAATDGKITSPLSKDFGITPYKTDVKIASMPGMNMGGSGGSSPNSGQPGGSTDDFHSPLCPAAGTTRATIFQILGVIA